MENPGIMAPLLFRKLIAYPFVSAEKSLLNIAEKFKFLQILPYLFIYSFLFIVRLLLSLFPSFSFNFNPYPLDFSLKPVQIETQPNREEDSSIARALSQLLSLVNQIPVGSRKYEIVRGLAEKLIDDNLKEDCEVLKEVNRTVLSAAFSRTSSQLEAAMLGQERERHDGAVGSGSFDYGFNRVWRAVHAFGDGARSRFGMSREEVSRSVGSAEKSAAELLWLAQKLAACGFAEEAVSRWGSASNLAWLALSAEPRLQGSLVRVSAFLFKEAKGMEEKEERESEDDEENEREEERERRMSMLMSWLPLLCRANNGTDAPVLSVRERIELERVLDETIESLKQEEEQEKVLSLWLHHFTFCPSSDWPNLQACYIRWCDAARKFLVAQ